jgi:MSHA biogenesis protein MshQ
MKLKVLGVLLISLLFSFNQSSFANACIDVFPGGIQSNTANKTISFGCSSQLFSNPSTVLSTKTVTNPSGCGTSCAKTCGTACCTASGTPVGTISPGSFQTSSNAGGNVTVSTNGTTTIDGTTNATTDYNKITVNNFGTLDFSAAGGGSTTTYRITTLTLKKGTTVNFQPGDYWIGSLGISGSGTVFNVVGSGTVRIYVSGAVNIAQDVTWNSGQSASQMLVYAYNTFTINDGNGQTNINALMYSQNNITLQGVTLSGAVTGVASTIGSSTQSIITYDSNAVNNLNFGSNFGSSCYTTSQFSVSAPSTGTNCQNMTITVTAQNSAAQTATGYADAITLTTQNSTGTWVSTSGGGTFSGGSSGTATYTFAASDNGVASFQLNYPSSGTSPLIVKTYQTNNTSVSGLSNSINFIPSSLLVTATAVSNPPASPPAAFSSTQIAGNNFTIYLTAYDPSNCGIVSSYSGAKTLRFYSTYVNPTSGTISLKINGTSVATSSGATQTTQSVTFANGVATVTGNYSDVGKLSLNVIDTSSGGPSGASGNFIVVPAQFSINIPSNSATQTTTPSSAAVSACLADTVFKKAGNAFTVNVQPQTSGGVVTPNYGNETSPEGITLQSATLLAPSGGQNGSTNAGAIANGSTFAKITGSAGPFTQAPYFTGTTFSFDEVGCINLSASITSGNYLSGGGNVTSTTVVGRFTPDHLSASGNAPQFQTMNISAAGNFTYLNQTFNYVTQPQLTITANALAGTTTKNYTGNFWKLNSSNFSPVYNESYYPVTTGNIIPSLTFSATIATPTFVDNGNGTGVYTYSGGSGLSIQPGANLSPPLTAEIQLKITTIIDADSVACTGTGCVSGGYPFGNTVSGTGIGFSGTGAQNGKEFLLGRLAVIDVLGLQTTSLTVPMQLQYYTSQGWVLNTLDSSTVFTGGASNLTVTPSSGLSTTASMASNTFTQGVLNITLSAPNINGSAIVQANLGSSNANLTWLEFAWPASTTNYPIGQATFGIYSGNPRIIFRKENVPQ